MFRRATTVREPLPIREDSRVYRLPPERDDSPDEETSLFTPIQVRALCVSAGDARDRVRALVETQLRQAAAQRLVGQALAVAAPRDPNGAPAWGDGAALAHGCPAHEAGFARLHCQLTPAEAAAARRIAVAEQAYPDIGVAERAGVLPRRDGQRLRAIATSPEQVAAWLGLAECEQPGALRRRLRRARPGEMPNAVPDRPLGPVDAPAGPEPDADHVLDLAVRLDYVDAETWDRAVRIASGQAQRVLSVPDAFRAMVVRLADEIAAGRVPATLAATVPAREWHVDPIRHGNRGRP